MSREPREAPLWGPGRRDAGLLARVRGALSSALVAPFASASGRWQRLRGASLAASIPPATASPSISRTLVRALEEEEQMDEVSLYPIYIDSGDFERERVLGSRVVDAIFSPKASSLSTNDQQINLVIEEETPASSDPNEEPRSCWLTRALHAVANSLKRTLHAEQRCLFIHVCARRSRLALAGLISMIWGLVVCGLSFYIISLVINGKLDDTIQEAVIMGEWRYAIVPTIAAVSLLLHGAYIVFGALLIRASKNSDLRSERQRDRIPEFLSGSFIGFSENGLKPTESANFPQSEVLIEEKRMEEDHKSQKKSLVQSRRSQVQIDRESSGQHQHRSQDHESYNADDAPSTSYVPIPINNTSKSHPHEMRTHLAYSHTPSRPTTNTMTSSSRDAMNRSISVDESVLSSMSKVDSSFIPEYVNSRSAEYSASTSSGRASFVSCTNTEISSSEWNTPRSQSYFEGFFFDCLSESSLTDPRGAIIAGKRPSVVQRITEFLKRMSKRNHEQSQSEKKVEEVCSEKEKQTTTKERPSFATHWLKPWLITASMNLKIYSLLSIALTFMGYYTIPALIIPLNASLLVCIVDVIAELRGVSETNTLSEPDAVKNNEVESASGFIQELSTSARSQIPPINETSPLL